MGPVWYFSHHRAQHQLRIHVLYKKLIHILTLKIQYQKLLTQQGLFVLCFSAGWSYNP